MTDRKFIIFCGDRNYNDENNEILASIINCRNAPEVVIVSGGCTGADSLTRAACVTIGVDFVECPANWERHKHAAGPIRNHFMVDFFKPKKVVAFHDDIEKSKGTREMLEYAKGKASCYLYCKGRWIKYV